MIHTLFAPNIPVALGNILLIMIVVIMLIIFFVDVIHIKRGVCAKCGDKAYKQNGTTMLCKYHYEEDLRYDVNDISNGRQ